MDPVKLDYNVLPKVLNIYLNRLRLNGHYTLFFRTVIDRDIADFGLIRIDNWKTVWFLNFYIDHFQASA